MEIGQAGKRPTICCRGSPNRFFVRAVRLPDQEKPDTVPEQFLLEVLCNRR